MDQAISATDKWLKDNRKYWYSSIDNMILTQEIRLNLTYWKDYVQRNSNYTLVRESTVSHDSDDNNFFVLADFNRGGI